MPFSSSKEECFFLKADGTRGKTDGGAPSVLVAYGARNVEALRSSNLKGKFILNTS